MDSGLDLWGATGTSGSEFGGDSAAAATAAGPRSKKQRVQRNKTRKQKSSREDDGAMPPAITVADSNPDDDDYITNSTDDQSEKEIKQLFRITQASGRVNYHVVYIDGSVKMFRPETIYDYVPRELVRKYEHESYAKDINMETVYRKRSDMGEWSGGTPASFIKKMEKMVLDTRRHANHGAEGVYTNFTETEDSTATRKSDKGKGVATMVFSKLGVRRPKRRAAVADGMLGHSTRTTSPVTAHSSSESPPAKKTKVTPKVVPPAKKTGKAKAELSPGPAEPKFNVVVPKPPGEARLAVTTTQPSILQFFHRDATTPSHGSSGNRGEAFAESLSDRETDDSSAAQLKLEQTSKKGHQTPAADRKRSRASSSVLKPPTIASSEDDLLAPASPQLSKTPHGPGSSARTSSKKPRSKARKKTKLATLVKANPPSEYEVESILDHSFTKGGHKTYLVKWVGFPHSQNTWEPEGNLEGSVEAMRQYESTLDVL